MGTVRKWFQICTIRLRVTDSLGSSFTTTLQHLILVAFSSVGARPCLAQSSPFPKVLLPGSGLHCGLEEGGAGSSPSLSLQIWIHHSLALWSVFGFLPRVRRLLPISVQGLCHRTVLTEQSSNSATFPALGGLFYLCVDTSVCLRKLRQLQRY